MKLSIHSKQRMRERTPFNSKERRGLFREALLYGKSPVEIDNERLKNYLLSKPKCKVKAYRGYIFIYSKNSKRLYTMYEIPERFKSGENGLKQVQKSGENGL